MTTKRSSVINWIYSGQQRFLMLQSIWEYLPDWST